MNKSGNMKRKICFFRFGCILVSTIVFFSSCATVLGGKITDCQRTKPVAGEPSRKLRSGAMIADILLFWPGTIVDFASGAIYKPCDKKGNK
jgi:hypothetical protein